MTQLYKDSNGTTGYSGLVGTSGTTYGDTSLFTDAEIQNMLTDGITQYDPPAPPPSPDPPPPPTTADHAQRHLSTLLTDPVLRSIVAKAGIDLVELKNEIETHVDEIEDWSATKHYHYGDLISFEDDEGQTRTYMALEDVATGQKPDDVYASDGSSGGFYPI